MPFFSISRALGYAGMALAFTVVGGVTVALIAEKMFPPGMRDQLLCTADLVEFAGQACVDDKIAQAVDTLQASNDALAGALNGQMVFEEGPAVGSVAVITGAIYREHTTRTGLVQAICWAIHDQGGLDPRLTLAVMEANGSVRPLQVDAFERAAVNIDDRTIADSRAACPWPRVS